MKKIIPLIALLVISCSGSVESKFINNMHENSYQFSEEESAEIEKLLGEPLKSSSEVKKINYDFFKCSFEFLKNDKGYSDEKLLQISTEGSDVNLLDEKEFDCAKKHDLYPVKNMLEAMLENFPGLE